MSKAAATKQVILQKSLELIYQKGYQGTSIDEIIATTNVTKGAFFYHFKSKEEMGLALINDIFYPQVLEGLTKPFGNSVRVTDGVYKMLHRILYDDSIFKVAYGCPVVNLVEEMAPISEHFKKALSRLIIRIQKAIESAFIVGQKDGIIRKDVDCSHVATFIMSGYSGTRNMGKIFGKQSYDHFLIEMKTYLKSLEQ